MKMCVWGEIIIGQLRTVSNIRSVRASFARVIVFVFLSFFVFLFVLFCSICSVFLRFYVTLHCVLIVVHCGI